MANAFSSLSASLPNGTSSGMTYGQLLFLGNVSQLSLNGSIFQSITCGPTTVGITSGTTVQPTMVPTMAPVDIIDQIMNLVGDTTIPPDVLQQQLAALLQKLLSGQTGGKFISF